MDATEKALSLFEDGLNCAQAILTAFGEPYGVSPASARKLGRPWGGGVGRMGQTCGAVTGAIILLGHAQDGALPEADARNKICASVKELIQRFKQRNGSVICRDLLGADISTEEGQRKIKEEMLMKKICPKFVEDASVILAELLAG